jgi:hypothetical protein
MGRRFIVSCILTSIIILVCVNSIAIAQSSTIVSPSPTPAIDDGQYNGPPLALSGTIYDADRRPVSGAVVTLYRDGKFVNMSSDETAANIYGGPDINPAISSYYSLGDIYSGGTYWFPNLSPGIYEVMVEKGQYKTSMMVDVNYSIAQWHHFYITADIRLDDYHGPAWTREQLSSNGAITGTVLDEFERPVPFSLIALTQNGQTVDIPHNPRYAYSNGTYIFTYLLPGQYQVEAETKGHVSTPVNVTVGNGTSNADITLQDYDLAKATYLEGLRMTPTPVPTPTSVSITPHPTFAAGIPVILVSMAIASAFILNSRKYD